MNRFLRASIIFTLLMIGVIGCTVVDESEETVEAPEKVQEVEEDIELEETTDATRLVVGRATDSQMMDPQASNSGADALIWTQIYEGLVRMNLDLEIEPALAHAWEQVDDYTWRFFLRDDVHFHNGDHFTAADVEFTILRALDSPAVSHIVSEIDPAGIHVIDTYIIEISTTEPFAPFLVNMTLPGMSILNERAIDEADGNVNENPIGTGPFVFVDWENGEHMTLDRNENYHGDLAAVAQLVFQVIPEPSSRMISLEIGEIDMALDITPSDMARIEESAELVLLRRPDLATHYMGFNTNIEPFSDVRVRQAINYAIDTEIMVDTILEGVGGVATGPINSSVWAHHPDLDGYVFNPDRARELLAEAGFPDGFETILSINGENAMRVNMAAVIQNQLADVGIDVSIQTFENAAYNEHIDAGEGEMYILGWTNVTADPENGLFPLFHSSRHGSSGNRTFFANERVDELLEAGRGAMDIQQRESYYLEAQEIIVDEAPWVFLTTGEILIATGDHITGFVPSPRGLHFFDTATIQIDE